MKTRLFLLLSATLLGFSAPAQRLNKYWIELSDKKDSPFSIHRPAEFLSARALERRARAGIEVVDNDLPVSPVYLEALKKQGLQIHGASRWLNAVAVIADSARVAAARSLPFVTKVVYLGPHLKFRNPPNRRMKSRAVTTRYPRPGGADNPMGYTSLQNSLLGLPPLYAAGHRGRGIWVAVMDGGFSLADTLPFFDSVALQGRLHPGWDFVERDEGLFESAAHGTSVLSVMAGNLPGYFVGGAPDADYFLFKTEDTGGEFPIEEVNWILGAEWADSLGIDIINASLGYTGFNEPALSHQYRDLDGRSAIGSRGATIAAGKGMIICNSAGNEGDNEWHYIGVPADAPGVIAVGSVDSDAAHSQFSSYGPTADGRIKPDLSAPGGEVVVAGGGGVELGISSGTSLASPMLVGALAALWSAFPEKTAAEILEAVFAAADQAGMPDNERGWGLPDMTTAWLQLGGYRGESCTYAFDRYSGELSLLVPHWLSDAQIKIRDVRNPAPISMKSNVRPNDISTVHIEGLSKATPGVYALRVINSNGVETLMIGL